MDITTLLIYVGAFIVILLISVGVFLFIKRALLKLAGLNKSKTGFESHLSTYDDPDGITIVPITMSQEETQSSMSSYSSILIQDPHANRSFQPRKQVVNLDDVHQRYGRTIRDCTCSKCMKIKKGLNGGK